MCERRPPEVRTFLEDQGESGLNYWTEMAPATAKEQIRETGCSPNVAVLRFVTSIESTSGPESSPTTMLSSQRLMEAVVSGSPMISP